MASKKVSESPFRKFLPSRRFSKNKTKPSTSDPDYKPPTDEAHGAVLNLKGSMLRTVDLFQPVRNWADNYVGGGQISMCNLAVIVGDETVMKYSTGYKDVESKERADLDTIVRYHSMTKTLTATAAMILVEGGFLGLDDPVEKYIPSFANVSIFVKGDSLEDMETRAPKKKMTIRHLLTHRAGFQAFTGIFTSHPIDQLWIKNFPLGLFAYPLEEFSNKIASIPLLYEPGEHYTYSVATDILGFVMEAITLDKFKVGIRDFMKENIFDKLGMKDTDFMVPEDQAGRVASLYSCNEAIGFGLERAKFPNLHGTGKLPALISGGGGLVGTLDDFTKFMKMLMNFGEMDGIRIVKEETVKLFTETNELGRNGDDLDENVDVESLHYDQKKYGNFAYYKGTGWNLVGAMIIDKEKTFGAEFSEKGEYGWAGMGSLWFGVSHLRARKPPSTEEIKIPVGVVYMCQTMVSKQQPTQPQFRWVAMKAAREYLEAQGYEFV